MGFDFLWICCRVEKNYELPDELYPTCKLVKVAKHGIISHQLLDMLHLQEQDFNEVTINLRKDLIMK